MAAPTVELTWEAKGITSSPTLPRSGHCAVTLPKGHEYDVLVFGGYTEDESLMEDRGPMGQVPKREVTNEGWLYSVDKDEWKQIAYEGDVPQPRLVAQTVVVDDKMWLIGGWNPSGAEGPSTILNDVWTLDLNTYKWSSHPGLQEQLQPISRFQAAVIGKKIYLHTHRSLDDILVIDTQNETVEKLPISSPSGASPPASRGLHSMVALDDRTLLIFGGAPQRGGFLNDVWTIDLQDNKWTDMTSKIEGQGPGPCCSTAMVKVDNGVLMWGGAERPGQEGEMEGLQPLDEAFLLRTDTDPWRWESVSVAGGADARPLPRNAHTMSLLPPREAGEMAEVVVHGGWWAFVKTYGDTFVGHLKAL